MDTLTPTRPAALSGRDAEAYVERRLGFPMAELGRFPKYFLIETVNTCNARCIMCAIDFDKKSKTLMDEALFDRIVAELHAHRHEVERVTLTLDGEPLIDKRLAGRIRKVKDAGIATVHISSNASLLNAKRAGELIASGLDLIHITIDSLNKDVYERIRRRLDFDVVMANVRRFIAMRDAAGSALKIRVQMVQQDLNFTEAAAFEAYWSRLLAPHDQVVVQKAHNWGSQVDVMAFGDEAHANDIPCIAPFGTFIILVDGQTRLCCMDVHDTYPLGRIQDSSIAKVWQGEAMAAARATHIAGCRADIKICDGCTLWRDDKQMFHEIDEADRAAGGGA